MKFQVFAARCALALACVLALAGPAHARFWQCAPYAREISGIAIFGNASTWWGQAAGRYERGNTPIVGAVLAFAASGSMRAGHVAMVSKVLGPRELLLTHANWSRRGGIETDVRAIDLSPNNDWTLVKVWYGPIGGLGLRANVTRGFIYPGSAPKTRLDAPVVLALAQLPGGVRGIVTFE